MARVNDSPKIRDAAVLVLERTHYDESMLELIAPVPIKQTLNLKNGDRIKIRVQLPSG
jgi:riboflavin kinase